MAWHYVRDAVVPGPLLLLSPPWVCACVHAQTNAEPILHSVRSRSEARRLAGRPLLAGIQGAVSEGYGRQYRHAPVDRKIHCPVSSGYRRYETPPCTRLSPRAASSRARNEVRRGLSAGGRWIRTLGPPYEDLVSNSLGKWQRARHNDRLRVHRRGFAVRPLLFLQQPARPVRSIEKQHPPSFRAGALPGMRHTAWHAGAGAGAADRDLVADLDVTSPLRT